MSLIGSATGAVLLLVLDPERFRTIVPVLILIGLVLVVVGPRLQAWAERRRAERDGLGGRPPAGA